MNYIPRLIEAEIKKASRNFPALILTGPRRAGKTTLLKKLFPGAGYYLVEDPDMIARIRSDPRSFLEELRGPVILDEIQNVPELLGYIRTRIDRYPRKTGQWFLTGSQEAPLMQGSYSSGREGSGPKPGFEKWGKGLAGELSGVRYGREVGRALIAVQPSPAIL
jgi:predicted AAA+ superfamily ATPase